MKLLEEKILREGTVLPGNVLKVNSFLNDQKRALYLSPEADQLASFFCDHPEGSDPIETAQIRGFLRQRNFYSRIPQELLDRFNRKRVESMNAWKQARAAQDFSIFQPFTEEVFELRRQIALALRPDEDPFATLVDLTDEGLPINDIRQEFERLRRGIVGNPQKDRSQRHRDQ